MYFHCKRFRRWLSGKSIDYFEDVFSNRDFHCTCQYCQRIPIYSYPPGNWHIPGKVNFEDDYPLSSLEGTPKTLCNMWFWLIREDHTHLIHISHGSQRTPSSRFHLGIISVQVPGIWMGPLVLVGVKRPLFWGAPTFKKQRSWLGSSDATSFWNCLLFTFFWRCLWW